jgi:hypothetical protein
MRNISRFCTRILGYEVKRISPPVRIGPDTKSVATVKEARLYTRANRLIRCMHRGWATRISRQFITESENARW